MKVLRQIPRTRISSEAVLSTAEDLFSRKGYRGTTITDISKKLKVSKPALYYYFKSKMEILDTLYSMTFEELQFPFEEVIDSDLPPDEKFKKLIENQIKVIGKNANRARIYFGDYKEFPRKVRNEIKRKRRRFNEKWIDVYKKGIEKGLFRNFDPQIAVYLIVGACNWIQMWYSPNGELKESELANMASALLSKGYLTNTDALSNLT
jgi:AcrR family transcriptional regulator